jgi:hypothetical protein
MSSRRAAIAVGALVFVRSACSSPPAADPPVAPRFVTQLIASPTPLATAGSASTKPNATAKPRATPRPTPKPTTKPKATPRPTSKPASYYKPPGWDGYSDVDCSDFDTHAHAQSFFKGTGGSPSNDPYGLDGDHDGVACETLP